MNFFKIPISVCSLAISVSSIAHGAVTITHSIPSSDLILDFSATTQFTATVTDDEGSTYTFVVTSVNSVNIAESDTDFEFIPTSNQ